MKPYREYHHILEQMLKHCVEESRTKTELMYESRLSHTQTQKYMALLLTRNLIAKTEEKKNRGNTYLEMYNITPKGQAVLELIKRLRELVE